jgi:hypothetical protein
MLPLRTTLLTLSLLVVALISGRSQEPKTAATPPLHRTPATCAWRS